MCLVVSDFLQKKIIKQSADDPLAILEEIKLELIASDQQLLQNWIQQQGATLDDNSKNQIHS